MCIKCLLGFVVILPSFFPSSYWWKWSWVNLAHTEWGKGLHSVNHQTGGIFFELSLVSILKLWILFLHPWNVFSFTTFKLPFFLHNNLTTIIFSFGEIVLIFNLEKKNGFETWSPWTWNLQSSDSFKIMPPNFRYFIGAFLWEASTTPSFH